MVKGSFPSLTTFLRRLKMAVALCPSCEGQITVKASAQVGDRVQCPHCYEDLEVIETQPIELDWAYDEDDWYEDDEDWEYEEDDDEDDDY
jgi:hypothetical protein